MCFDFRHAFQRPEPAGGDAVIVTSVARDLD